MRDIVFGPLPQQPVDIDALAQIIRETMERMRTPLWFWEVQPLSEEPRMTLADGTQIYPEHRNLIKEGAFKGQQEGYVVLAEEERAKGFVRPVRRTYKHLTCGEPTTMGRTLAETYARDPSFYSGTFCCHCQGHFPVGPNGEFVWEGSNEKVGT